MSTLFDNVRMMVLDLPVGSTTKGMTCPDCGGGLHNDKSFYVTRNEGGLLFICHRASCGVSGFIPSRSDGIRKPVPKAPKVYKGSVRFTYTNEMQTLRLKYHYNKEQILLAELITRISLKDGRYVYPVTGMRGEDLGVEAKTHGLVQYDGPKSVLYPAVLDAPQLGVVARRNNNAIILVEDVISAIKCSIFQPSTGWLIGTSLRDKEVKYLKDNGITDVYLWLDPDATHKAVKIKRRYELFFNKFVIITSHKDPKDLTNEELEEAWGGKENTSSDTV